MRHENRTFDNETIAVDGHEFINCTFIDCTLTYAGTSGFEITPFATEKVTWKFLGAAEAGRAMGLKLLSISLQQASKGSILHVGNTRLEKLDDAAGADAGETSYFKFSGL